MINKPFHKLSADERKEYAETKVYTHPFPNRSARRDSVSKRNLVRQEVTFRNEDNELETKVVYHQKTSNIPRQYLGVKAVKGSLEYIRNQKKIA